MQKPKIDPGEAHKTMILIWFFLLTSQVLFLGLLWMIKPQVFGLSDPIITNKNFIPVIAAALLSVVCLVISFVRSKQRIAQAIAEQKIYLVQSAVIDGCFFSDLITLLGMLLAFTLDYQWFFLWFLLGAGATILHYPTRQNIDAASYQTI
jgi:hypothetical protein